MLQSLELASQHNDYAAAARRVLDQECLVEEEAQEAARGLVLDIVEGGLEVSALRKGVAWASALDREVVERGADSFGELEVTARRIMHHAGRCALRSVKTEKRLTVLRARHAMIQQNTSWQWAIDNPEERRRLFAENLVQYT